MLVLGRAVGEWIFIDLPDGRQIKLTVVEIDRNKVRLGIEAPRDVPVFREELIDGSREKPAVKRESKNANR